MQSSFISRLTMIAQASLALVYLQRRHHADAAEAMASACS